MSFSCAERRLGAVVINRGFWPVSDVPGESLLALAENLAIDYDTFVLSQSNVDMQAQCRDKGRAMSVQIRSCSAFTDSNSKIVARVIETVYFAIWVLIQLCRVRPAFIYVATDPPIILPFIVCIYSKIFGAKYTYHLQDIHPEASSVVVKMPALLHWFLVRLDNITLRYAKSIVTLTPSMAEYLQGERGITSLVHLVDNASAYPTESHQRIKNTMVFCGNAGRLQEIPLVVSAIEGYLERGGKLSFTFLGSGTHAHLFRELSDRWSNVVCLGYLPLDEAIEVLGQHEWGLLPVNNSVLKYAFPSKTSAYAAAGCKILAICEQDSSLASWVYSGQRGLVSLPVVESIIDAFFSIERGESTFNAKVEDYDSLSYSFDLFSKTLKKIITR